MSRHDQVLVAILQFKNKFGFYPTGTELETFKQVRSRTLAKRFAELRKEGLLRRSFGKYTCHATNRKAHHWWLTWTGHSRALRVLEKQE